METMIVKIDGVDFEVPKAAGQAILKMQARADELAETIKGKDTEIATVTARADKADEDRDAAIAARDAANDPTARNDAVKARVELVSQALTVLGDKDANDKAWNFDDDTDDDIRRLVIAKVSPAATEKIDAMEGDAQAAYIAARFDGAIESASSATPDKSKGNRGLDRVRVQGTFAGGERSDAIQTAREKSAEVNRQRGLRPLGQPLPTRASLVKD